MNLRFDLCLSQFYLILLTHTPQTIWKTPVSLLVSWGPKSESPEETHPARGEHATSTHRPEAGIQTLTLEVQGDPANLRTSRVFLVWSIPSPRLIYHLLTLTLWPWLWPLLHDALPLTTESYQLASLCLTSFAPVPGTTPSFFFVCINYPISESYLH